jgi:hypothetical protein
MHPHTMSRLALQHTAELRAAADRARPHLTPPRPRNTARYRAGWTLVEIGLRLAGVANDG